VLPRPVDQIIGQHDAHLIPEGLPGAGNILVFDNQGEAGYPRVSPGISRARACWRSIRSRSRSCGSTPAAIPAGPEWSFYSSFISSARRLPNGNTLIDEGMNGRIFQVTPARATSPGNTSALTSAPTPVAGAGKPGAETNWLYRAQPVPYNWVPAGTPRSEKAVTPPELGKFRVATN
jgi:hypothetical protein